MAYKILIKSKRPIHFNVNVAVSQSISNEHFKNLNLQIKNTFLFQNGLKSTK